MITGHVTADREAIVRLKLRGTNGVEAEVEAVLDTGFTEYLSLPQNWVTALALPLLFTDQMTLECVQELGKKVVPVWHKQVWTHLHAKPTLPT
jgi:predicted aspartyl protease